MTTLFRSSTKQALPRIVKLTHCMPATLRQLCAMLAMMAAIFAATPAQAGSLYAIANGIADHLDAAPNGAKLNEQNWGAGFQYDFEPWHEHWIPFITATGFQDSNFNPSFYAGGGIMRRFMLSEELDKLHLDAGLVAFLMTRKDFRNNRPFFVALPALTFGTDHLAINATYIPKVHPKMVALFYYQLKIKLLEF